MAFGKSGRMALVLKSWESHCAHPQLPRPLAHRLVSAGFRLDDAAVFPILNLKWDDDAYSKGLAGLIRDFVGRKDELPTEDLKEWYDEFIRLSEAGATFSAAIVTFFECPNRFAKRTRYDRSWPFCDMAWDANEGRFKSRSGHQRAGRAKPVYEFTPYAHSPKNT